MGKNDFDFYNGKEHSKDFKRILIELNESFC